MQSKSLTRRQVLKTITAAAAALSLPSIVSAEAVAVAEADDSLTRPLTAAQARARDLKFHAPKLMEINVRGCALAPKLKHNDRIVLRRLEAGKTPVAGQVYLFRSRPKELREGWLFRQTLKQLKRITRDGRYVLVDVNRRLRGKDGVQVIPAAEVFYIGQPIAVRRWKRIRAQRREAL